MCKYCKLNKEGNSDNNYWKVKEKNIHGVNIYSVSFYADTATINIWSDLERNEHHIPINYCPLCGRSLRDSTTK